MSSNARSIRVQLKAREHVNCFHSRNSLPLGRAHLGPIDPDQHALLFVSRRRKSRCVKGGRAYSFPRSEEIKLRRRGKGILFLRSEENQATSKREGHEKANANKITHFSMKKLIVSLYRHKENYGLK